MPSIAQPLPDPMPSPYPGSGAAESEKVGPIRVSAERVEAQSSSVLDLIRRLDRLHSRLNGFPILPPGVDMPSETGGENDPCKRGDIPQLCAAIENMDGVLVKLSETISELEKL